MKKILTLVACLSLVASLAIGGSIAYLTATDTAENTFTIGNVSIDIDENGFKDGTELKPGVDITKEASIKNTGSNDAYVWMNIIITPESIADKITPNFDTTGAWAAMDTNVYLYKSLLKAGDTTSAPGLKSVTLNEHIDVRDGKLVYVNNGELQELCSMNDVKVVVNAYAIQADGMVGDTEAEKAEAAYTAYAGQWGSSTNGATPSGDVNNTAELRTSLANGGNVELASSITVTEATSAAKNTITKDTTIDFGNNAVTLNIPNATSATENWVGINVDGGTVVMNGENGGVMTADNMELYAVVVRNGADLTIKGGKYVGGTTAVQVSEGTLTIEGGYFEAQTDTQDFVINCKDAAYRDGSAKIIVKGGTFVNFNPAQAPCENPQANFVPAGYKVVSETKTNGDTWYTVIADSEASSVKTLKNALENGGAITITKDIEATDYTETGKNIVTEDTEINFGDNTLTLNLPNADGNTANWVGLNVNGGSVVLNGEDGGIVTADNMELYAVVVRNGADLTIKGGKYVGGTTAVQVSEGTLTIEGGYFEAQTDTQNFVLNCMDAAYKNGSAKIIVKGGTFVNFNPAQAPCENPQANFVPAGYKVETTTDGDNTLYTVVPN